MGNLISIIVPVYNAEKTLQRCVSSLREQTHSHLEIILVNDGSRDGSLPMCRAFAELDSRIRVIDQPNGGVSAARNAGLDAATGDYIMFCDSDDWVEPDWCGGMLLRFSPGSMVVCESVSEENPGKMEMSGNPVISDRNRIMHHPQVMCALWNKLFSRGVIEENHIRFQRELNLGEDFCFVLEYLCHIEGKIIFLTDAWYHYDDSTEGSLSKRAPALQQCDKFYWTVTNAMERLGATDRQSKTARNIHVMTHFERAITEASRRRDWSIWEKFRFAGTIQKLESYRDSSTDGLKWGNPVYLWLHTKQMTKLAMLFLLLRNLRDRL